MRDFYGMLLVVLLEQNCITLLEHVIEMECWRKVGTSTSQHSMSKQAAIIVPKKLLPSSRASVSPTFPPLPSFARRYEIEVIPVF